MTKFYNVMQEGSHLYDAVLDYENDSYSLQRTKSTGYWISKYAGKLLWTVKADGNLLTLRSEELKKKIVLDYSQMAELRILLNLINTKHSLFALSTAVEVSAEEIPV
jgi:hypothetical protein